MQYLKHATTHNKNNNICNIDNRNVWDLVVGLYKK